MDILTIKRLVTLAVVFMLGCLGTSPEEERREAQGPYEDGNEEHRPGQPCLVCHSHDYNPGGDVFEVAGTVYLMASDDDESGIEGASVDFTDATGRTFSALTNRKGNFMVEVDSGLAAPEQRNNGRLGIPFRPEFPLRVAVRYADLEAEMETEIRREGSCAGCHRGEAPSRDHVDKVFASEDTP